MNSTIKTIISVSTLVFALCGSSLAAYDRNTSIPSPNSLESIMSKMSSNFHNHSWDPFKELQRMRKEFDEVFGRMNSHFANDPFFKSAFDKSWSKPLIDVLSNKNEYIIKMDIPGVDNQDIDVKAEDNMLSVRASVSKYKESGSTKYISKERSVNRFQRSISLERDADVSKMQSDYKDGVLTVTIPRKK